MRVQSIVLIFIFITVALVYKEFYRKKVDSEGVISIAKVMDIEVGKSGSSCKIEIYFQNKRVETYVPGIYCLDECIGNFYFVRFLPGKIKTQPALYTDKPVPGCILDSLEYFTGWSSIPDCRTFRSAMLTE